MASHAEAGVRGAARRVGLWSGGRENMKWFTALPTEDVHAVWSSQRPPRLHPALKRYPVKRLLLVLALLPSTALAAPLTQCGETVKIAELTADLDCSTFDGPAVTLTGRASLNLAGFTLTGSLKGAVACAGRCTISGGGSIVAPAGLDQNLNTAFAIASTEYGSGRLSLSGIAISGYSMLATAARIDLSGVALSASRGGISAASIQAVDSSFTDCESPVSGIRATLTNVAIVNAGSGAVAAKRVVLSGTSITQSDGFAVVGNRITAENSTLTDNCQAPSSSFCADIFTHAVAPRLTDTICETSLQPSGDSWHVCTLD